MKNTLNADDYVRAARRLEKSAGWKYQAQRFMLNRLSEIARVKEEAKTGSINHRRDPNSSSMTEGTEDL